LVTLLKREGPVAKGLLAGGGPAGVVEPKEKSFEGLLGAGVVDPAIPVDADVEPKLPNKFGCVVVPGAVPVELPIPNIPLFVLLESVPAGLFGVENNGGLLVVALPLPAVDSVTAGVVEEDVAETVPKIFDVDEEGAGDVNKLEPVAADVVAADEENKLGCDVPEPEVGPPLPAGLLPTPNSPLPPVVLADPKGLDPKVPAPEPNENVGADVFGGSDIVKGCAACQSGSNEVQVSN
jgi:hypothetical protein